MKGNELKECYLILTNLLLAVTKRNILATFIAC